MDGRIQGQVRLPVRIALGVVLQGIRIRFGRSLVTLSGVALGVAFLMSIFTGQVVKGGISHEEAVRSEIGRMYGFLSVEVGPATDRTVDVLQVGPLSELELRLIDKLRDEDVSVIRCAALPGVATPREVGRVRSVKPASLGAEAIGIIVMGQTTSAAARWRAAVGPNAESTPIAVARRALLPSGTAAAIACLERKLRPEEIAAAAEAARRGKFRSGWIITISLLVTVIGIANAMLMSVTERFREIGTMKCLGALSSFIRRIFLIESSLIGVVGSVAGAVFGMVFSICAYGLTYGFEMVVGSMAWLYLGLYFVICVLIGLTLAILAAIYPAHFASRMVPADALRSNI